MKAFWANALVMGVLLAGVNAASADMCNGDLSDQNCSVDVSTAWGAAPFSSGLFNSNSNEQTPHNLGGPVLEGTTTDPTGINGLVVDNTTYNVTFSLTTLNTFTEGSLTSQHADTDLAAALNSLGVTGLGNQKPTQEYAIDVDNVLHPFFDGPGRCVEPVCSAWSAQEFSECGQLGNSNGYFCEAADFTPVDVPEPGTAGLFGMALLALGGLGLRRKFV